jgi:hypothetical protein
LCFQILLRLESSLWAVPFPEVAVVAVFRLAVCNDRKYVRK